MNGKNQRFLTEILSESFKTVSVFQKSPQNASAYTWIYRCGRSVILQMRCTMAAIRQRPYPFLFVGTYREALMAFAAWSQQRSRKSSFSSSFLRPSQPVSVLTEPPPAQGTLTEHPPMRATATSRTSFAVSGFSKRARRSSVSCTCLSAKKTQMFIPVVSRFRLTIYVS